MNEITHLTSAEAAVRLRKTVQTLANWRVRGYGPRWRKDPGKNGRVLYAVADVEEWLGAGKRQSTAENPIEPEVDIFS